MHCKNTLTLIHDNNFSIDDHMMELSVEVQVALHVSKVLQENWNKTMLFILKINFEFLSHFGIIIQILYTFGVYVKKGEKYIYFICKEGKYIVKEKKYTILQMYVYSRDICMGEQYIIIKILVQINKKYLYKRNFEKSEKQSMLLSHSFRKSN